jgi:O-antigen/teichoic acid export membrane protein
LTPKLRDETEPIHWFRRLQDDVKGWSNRRLGIDRAIGFNIFARAWSSLAGLVTVALIARFLTPQQQGYYYTFGSLIALQIVFELGFSLVILQMASHERAHLSISVNGHISGDPVAHQRLASVLQKTVKWYSAGAALLAVFLLLSGYHFFSTHQKTDDHVSWQMPWCLAALGATFTFQLDPLLSFMEGCGFVPNVARLRFIQAAAGSICAWLVLISHRGLFAPGVIIIANAVGAFAWLLRKRGLLLSLLRLNPGGNKIRWMKEVWPFQWRIGVSWLCGYFIFQLYNPVLFAFRGPVEAGQMGMSLTIMNALIAVAISWINTKAAPFGAMIARREFQDLDRTFFVALKQALSVCVGCSSATWLAVAYLNWIQLPMAHRVLSPVPFGFLLLLAPMNVLVFAEATYLRAHKQEKFLLNSILGAILTGTSTYFFGKAYGATGVAISSLAIGALVGVPLGTYTFIKYRRLWRAH